MRDCERCINAKPYGGPEDNRCSAWACEFIDRAEAIKIYNEYKNGELISRGAIVKALEVFNDHDNGNKHFLNGIKTAMEIVTNLPTIEERKEENK